MPPTATAAVRYLRRCLAGPATTDGDLIRRFADRRDEAAFAELVDRHGPMVLGVARRAAGDYQAAEDVAQATFLTLARRACHLRHPDAVPGWLHRTAYFLGLKAARARARRERAERNAPVRPPAGPPDLAAHELLTALDAELARLPDRFRLPLVLCCLEGLSQDEAAQRLGWTPDSVRGRLQRGRNRLRAGLARRGLAFSAGAGAALLLLPSAVDAGSLRAAALQIARGETVRPEVVALTAGVAGSGPGWIVALVAAGSLAIGIALFPQGPVSTPPPLAPSTPRAEQPADRQVEGIVARLGASPHRIGNSAFALTRDGTEILTVSPEGIVQRFDAATGKPLGRRQLTDRTDVSPVGQALAQLSADGSVAAIGEIVGGQLRVTVWDVPAGKVRFRPAPDKPVRFSTFALAPDGKSLALREDTDRVRLSLYDTVTGAPTDLGELEYNTYAFEFSADSRRLVVSQTSAERGEPRAFLGCYDVPAGKRLWKLPAERDRFAVSPDGRLVVFADFNRRGYQVIETDPKTGTTTVTKQPQAFGVAHPNVPIAFAPDGRTLVACHFGGNLILWDVQDGKEVKRSPMPADGPVGYGPQLGAFSADSKTVITTRGGLRRWDLTTGKSLFEPETGDGLGGSVERLAFTSDGKEVFASGWGLDSGRWDAATGKRLAYFFRERFGCQLVTTPAGLRSVASDDAQKPHEVVVYDPIGARALKTVRWAGEGEVGVNGLRAYPLAADGRTLLVLHCDEPGRGKNSHVTVYDIVSDRQLARHTLPGLLYYVESPFSPCGRWLAFGGKVYHARTGTELFAPATEAGERLTVRTMWNPAPTWFSTDGRLMAGRLEKDGKSTEALAVWELASGRLLLRLAGGDRIGLVVFGSDGRSVAVVDGRGVRVLDLLTGKPLAEFWAPDIACEASARGAGPQTVAFSPDGRRLATGHRDGSVTVWAVPAPPTADAADVWAGLASESPATGRAAADRAACDPSALKEVLTRFRPPAEVPDPTLAALIADLDSDSFAKREAATRALRERGGAAGPALRRALAGTSSAEARQRLEEVAAAIPAAVERLPLTGHALRGVRAIEALERARTAEAREALQAWAEQGREPRMATEARAALARWGPAK